MNGLQAIWNGLDWSVLTDILISVIPALVCITLHELAHGYAAYLLGDMTARNAGRLSLNPLKHLDIAGLVMMLVFKFGWAKPVPVDMRSFRNPKQGMAITALAGPLCNLILSAVLMFVYGLAAIPLISSGSEAAYIVLQTIGTTAYLSLSLAVFNLLPIPPLDGSKVLFSLMNRETYYKLMRYERYGMILLIVVLAGGILSKPLSAITSFLFDKLFVLAEIAGDIVIKIFM